MAGNSEFHSTPASADSSCSSSGQCKNNICWTDALLPVYVDKFGVEPSHTFQVFVQEFDVDVFRTKLDAEREAVALTYDLARQELKLARIYGTLVDGSDI